MPDQETLERAREDAREGKAPSTQAGEFVRQEIDHIREGKHGARSTKQAIAIGLSEARRAGVKIPAKGKRAGTKTRSSAAKKSKTATKRGSRKRGAESSTTRSRAAKKALKREGRGAASKSALAEQARASARKRSASERSAAAKKAARTRKRTGR